MSNVYLLAKCVHQIEENPNHHELSSVDLANNSSKIGLLQFLLLIPKPRKNCGQFLRTMLRKTFVNILFGDGTLQSQSKDFAGVPINRWDDKTEWTIIVNYVGFVWDEHFFANPRNEINQCRFNCDALLN